MVLRNSNSLFNNPTCFPGVDEPLASISNCGRPYIFRVQHLSDRPQSTRALHHARSAAAWNAKSRSRQPSPRLISTRAASTSSLPSMRTPLTRNALLLRIVPLSLRGNIYRYVSEGNFKQNQLIDEHQRPQSAPKSSCSASTLWVMPTATRGESPAFRRTPTTSARIMAGLVRRAANRFFLGGSIALPYLFRLSPFMVVSSGSPFTITSPIDDNGDQIYNDRPGLVSSATCPGPPPTTGSGPQNNIYCTHVRDLRCVGSRKIPSHQFAETGPSRIS